MVQEIIGEAPAMQEVFRAIGRLSNSNITVLINGESGTGKELVAQALHKHSPRKSAKFIALNMAAIPRDSLKANCSATKKALLPVRPSDVKGGLSKPMVARSFWTRLETCLPKPKPDY